VVVEEGDSAASARCTFCSVEQAVKVCVGWGFPNFALG
jgi:hypothetical protein